MWPPPAETGWDTMVKATMKTARVWKVRCRHATSPRMGHRRARLATRPRPQAPETGGVLPRRGFQPALWAHRQVCSEDSRPSGSYREDSNAGLSLLGHCKLLWFHTVHCWCSLPMARGTEVQAMGQGTASTFGPYVTLARVRGHASGRSDLCVYA